ncbi:GYDIA family GHMP kinase [Mangrovimonas aestuarii]|uniref:GYDIA family GHMP kinase n=1 Tax=Mangrovimonas aestuarii TaxID=3018443 RepID=UPI002379A274|nr:GYDIA family GHMP kinase [Mangrovimonas aestuarii]
MQKFYSNGKLLISGEYVVLDGALSLALPTSFGQTMEVTSNDSECIIWKSLDHEGNPWIEVEFPFKTILEKDDKQLKNETDRRLVSILHTISKLNSELFKTGKGSEITTTLDFPRDWGLGSSSTLINNLAQWANIDPYKLLALTFGGSGYDIACASHNKGITYQLDKTPIVKEVGFNPEFKDKLYFVHLNQKQNSREGISHYKEAKGKIDNFIKVINTITLDMLSCKTLPEFQMLMEEHENIIGSITKQTPVKESLFPDFNGSIKSLGAWGGDFILAASESNPKAYFEAKGFHTVLPFKEMILK